MLSTVLLSSVLRVLYGTCTALVAVGGLLVAVLLSTSSCPTLLEEDGAERLMMKGLVAGGTGTAVNGSACFGVVPPVVRSEADEAEVELLESCVSRANGRVVGAVRRPVAAFDAAECAGSRLRILGYCTDKCAASPLS